MIVCVDSSRKRFAETRPATAPAPALRNRPSAARALMVSEPSISLSVDDDFPWLTPLSRLLLMATLSPEETEAFDQLPAEEALALLDLLVNRYGITLKRSGAPMTESDRHQLDVGHRLSFGCCRPVDLATSGAESRACAY